MSPRKRLFQSTVMIRMPDELRRGLQALAEREGRSLSDYCRAALREHLEGGGFLAGASKAEAKLRVLVRRVVAEELQRKGRRGGKA